MSFKVEKKQKPNSQIYANETIKNGYLYVKLPPNLRGIVGQWKAWNKKWIELNFENNNSDQNNISVNLFVFRNKSGTNGLRNIIYQQNFESQNAVIFRCKSRTQEYAFTICNNNEPIIHLASISENGSQLWMQCLRKALWPPNPLMELEISLKGHFYVSIIDNENSHRAGLLGAYGYLQVSAKKIILTHPQTGHVIQEWNLSSFYLENPFENILQIIANKSSSCSPGNIFFYCNDANEVINRINKEKDFIKYVTGYGGQLKEQFSNISSSFPKSKNSFRDLNLGSNNDMIYSNKINSSNKSSDSSFVNCNTFRIRTAKEIPETMLNCSFSSPNCLMNQICDHENSENIYDEPLDLIASEQDMYEEIDKIYEEIATQECNDGFRYSEDKCLNEVSGKKFDDLLPPELPPKKRISTNPITIRYNSRLNFSKVQKSKPFLQNEMSDTYNEICNYDMFSTIVTQTNISLLNRQKLLNKSSNLDSNVIEKEDYKREPINDYYEMRPISMNPNISYSSDSVDYVDMRSFSI